MKKKKKKRKKDNCVDADNDRRSLQTPHSVAEGKK
jgi:hypothetical protein